MKNNVLIQESSQKTQPPQERAPQQEAPLQTAQGQPAAADSPPAQPPDASEMEWRLMLAEVLDLLKQRRAKDTKPAFQWHPVNKVARGWMREQRRRHAQHRLSPERSQALLAAGLVRPLTPAEAARASAPGLDKEFMRQNQRWEEMHRQLAAFQARHGHCEVPKAWPENKVLSIWVQYQREYWRKKRLLPERQHRLEAMGFSWEPTALEETLTWAFRLRQLQTFHAEHGHYQVTRKDSQALRKWCLDQTRQLQTGKMPAEKLARLEEAGISLEQLIGPNSHVEQDERAWQAGLAELRAWKEAHGHLMLPANDPEVAPLRKWAGVQRRLRSNKTLAAERVAALDALDFYWTGPAEQSDEAWERFFHVLQAHHAAKGRSQVYPRDNPTLYHWQTRQRVLHQQGKLRKDREEKLKKAGFQWQVLKLPFMTLRPPNHTWLRQLEALRKWKEIHGHLDVPNSEVSMHTVYSWIHHQRAAQRRKLLHPERIRLLDELGFEWRPSGKTLHRQWEQRLQELLAFRKKHGHFNVPEETLPELAVWTREQRQSRQEGRMPPRRKLRLDRAGFPWKEPAS